MKNKNSIILVKNVNGKRRLTTFGKLLKVHSEKGTPLLKPFCIES